MPMIGCQTYTWEMLGGGWTGNADDLLQAIGDAGYAGIEITDRMIGSYFERPRDFAQALKSRGLTLVAFALGSDSGYTEPGAMKHDLAAVDRALRFLAEFPGAFLSLGSATVMSPGPSDGKFETAAKIYNAAAAAGKRMGVPVAFHPSSHHNTLLGTRAEYDRIMELTDPALIGWIPDTGHMLRGGHDMRDTLSAHLDRIRYLHLKDADANGHWRMLGEGVCDVPATFAFVGLAPNFTGWVVLEEESDTAAADPAAAVRRNHQTIRRMIA